MNNIALITIGFTLLCLLYKEIAAGLVPLLGGTTSALPFVLTFNHDLA